MIVNISRALLVENFLLCVFIALCNFCRHSVNNGGYMMEKHRNLVWWIKNCCCCVEWHGNLSILHVHEQSNFVIGDIQCQSKVLSVGWWNNKTEKISIRKRHQQLAIVDKSWIEQMWNICNWMHQRVWRALLSACAAGSWWHLWIFQQVPRMVSLMMLRESFCTFQLFSMRKLALSKQLS